MNKSKSVKCKICGKKYVSKQSLIDHIEKSHASNIPEGWNAARYENFLRTGKTEGRCVYCHKETGWNDATGKYNRMCGSEKCKKVARDNANKNYIGLHGKPYSINNPEQQTKMIYSRKNSGKYVFEGEDGKKYVAMYDSSYGRDFFEMIDTLLSWDGSDIIAPSPHTYWYEYEGKKHFYIPDAYSTSLNLEIEFKDGGDNPNKHPKIQAIDKVKEQKKDEVMESLKGQVNYIKICNKDYTGFFAMLSKLREKDVCQLPKWESKLESITESYLSNDLNWATCFGWYHLEKEKKEYTGWDEEQYFKDLDYAIRQELSELSLHQQKGQATRYVYTLGKENRGVLLGIITFKWYDYWDHIDPQYEYYWETQEEVNLDDIDTEKNPVLESTYEKTSPSMILSKSFLRRQYKLRHPLLNYNDLMEMYRKKLFHKNLNIREWQTLYNELINVREYLKKVVNGNSEEDKRMNYEAKKALKQVESFIQYMEEKNASKKPINESYVMENSNYRDYMIHGNFDYIKQRLKNMNSPLSTYTSMYDTFNVYDGIPKNMDKNTLEIQVDNVGKEIYKNYWLKNKGTKANMYAPFKFYSDCHNLASYCNIYDKYYKTTSLFNKPSLYFYNFEKNHRRYSVVIATNDKEYDVYLVVNYDLLKISTGNVVNESIELENIITESIVNESIDIFQKGDLHDYAKYADLDSARGPIEESGISSTLDKDFKSKPRKSLNSFTKKRLTKPMIDEASKDSNLLRHLDPFDDNCFGFYDGNKLACYVSVNKEKDGINWITALEVMPEYRGCGLSKQLLDFATKTLHANALGVSKSNEVALSLYKNYGFKISKESEKEVQSGKRNNYRMYYGISVESNFEPYINSLEGEDIMESRPVKEISSYDSKFQEIIDFNTKLNNYEYIIPSSGKLTVTSEDFMKYYKVLTPKEFETYKGGVCWDYVAYEAEYFKKHFPFVKFKTYFVVSINGITQPTHTFILFNYNGYVYWFESSWKSMHGIYKFKNENDALDYICKVLRESVENYKEQYITTFDPLDKKLFGMSCAEYMGYMEKRLPRNPIREVGNPKPPMETITSPLTYDSSVYEATFIEAIKDDTAYYPVFIFLSYTGTNMAKLKKAFTHDPYAHSSLSFDTELNHMISFNRDGMVDENIFESVYKKNASNIRYSLYVYMATADEYEAMREFVNTLLEKRSKLKYNMLGLTNFIFGRGSEREDKFFCSEFVASVISAGNNKVVKTRPYMTSPYMLAKNKNFVFIKTGILKNYDSKIVDKIVAEKLEEGGFTNVTFK